MPDFMLMQTEINGEKVVRRVVRSAFERVWKHHPTQPWTEAEEGATQTPMILDVDGRNADGTPTEQASAIAMSYAQAQNSDAVAPEGTPPAQSATPQQPATAPAKASDVTGAGSSGQKDQTGPAGS